jgi:hypothetical protein
MGLLPFAFPECETSGGTTACVKYIWAGDLRVAMKQVTGGAVTYYHGNYTGDIGTFLLIRPGVTGLVVGLVVTDDCPQKLGMSR